MQKKKKKKKKKRRIIVVNATAKFEEEAMFQECTSTIRGQIDFGPGMVLCYSWFLCHVGATAPQVPLWYFRLVEGVAL